MSRLPLESLPSQQLTFFVFWIPHFGSSVVPACGSPSKRKVVAGGYLLGGELVYCCLRRARTQPRLERGLVRLWLSVCVYGVGVLELYRACVRVLLRLLLCGALGEHIRSGDALVGPHGHAQLGWRIFVQSEGRVER